MIENLVNSFKDIVEKTKDIKEYMPSFFDETDSQMPKEKLNINEPISKKDSDGLTDFQQEVLADNYGLSGEEIQKYRSWEDFESSCYEDVNEREHDDVDISELLDESVDLDVEKIDSIERYSGCPIDGHGGQWEGFRGDSNWYPAREEIPKNLKTNPEGLTWGEILDKYGVEGISFKEGEPDFSKVSKGTVEIDNFSENRYGKGGNFDQAWEKLAEQRGCTKEEVKEWMKDNKYTWHEKADCKTMEKVPTEVHGNIRHEGGISEIKSKQDKSIEIGENS